MKKTLAFAALAIVSCKLSKHEESSTTTTTADTTTTSTVTTAALATAAMAPTTAVTAPTSASTAPSSALPRAKDVLPAGEVSGESLAVIADGYRFQIPPTLSSTGTGNVYSGKVSGMIADTTLSIWVTKEPFTGDAKALVTREVNAAKTAKATITQAAGPAMMSTQGSMDNSHAQRFVAQFADRYEMREVTVYKGTAYIFHCETPATLNAWINVGSDCMIKGTTFHVAPPATK